MEGSKVDERSVRKIWNKYTIERLMKMIDKEKLDALKVEFEAHPDGLEYYKFIKHVKEMLGEDSSEKYDLIHGLCKLFTEIDTNEDRKMEWREFTQYVIDTVIKNPVKKNDKGELPTQKELLNQAHLQDYIKFHESNIIDCMSHEGNIQKVIYLPHKEKLLLVETKSHIIKFMKIDMHLKEQINLYDEKYKEEGNYFVMAAHYDEKNEILGCACSNKTIQYFKREDNKIKKLKTIYTKGVQYGIWYLPRHKAWITTSKTHEAHPKTREDEYKTLKNKVMADNEVYGVNYINDWSYNAVSNVWSIFCSIEAHKGKIMDVIELKFPPLVVTCSLDQSIKLWDLFTGDHVGSLKPQHVSGVRELDYTPEYSGTIISVGHENYVKIWSAEVSINQAYVGSLIGHNNTVVSAKFIQKLPYAVSVDNKTIIRVWDIRTLACLQKIPHERKRFDCVGLCVLSKYEKFIIYGHKLVMFDTKANHVKEKTLKLMKEAYPIKVKFNKYDKAFMVTTK